LSGITFSEAVQVKMKKRTFIKIIVILAVSGMLVALATTIYLLNLPHRDVLSARADHSLSNSEITREYLNDPVAADQKYLASDGDSKILELSGTVSSISEDFNGQKVVLLKEDMDEAGVSATFTAETNYKIASLQIGEKVTVKGVIRSGASYDEDLGFYEHVILEKCDLVTQK